MIWYVLEWYVSPMQYCLVQYLMIWYVYGMLPFTPIIGAYRATDMCTKLFLVFVVSTRTVRRSVNSAWVGEEVGLEVGRLAPSLLACLHYRISLAVFIFTLHP